jgi:uncharacterized protein YigE (DUF2233 family)
MNKWLLIFLALIIPQIVHSAPPELSWRSLRAGLEIARISAETHSGSGDPELLFLRINPKLYRFQILYDPPQQFSAEVWRESSNALAVCNIGQYDDKYKYLGLLIKDGVEFFPLASASAGLFLAETSDLSLPAAMVLDLRYSAFDPRQNPYTQAAQSLMLIDRYGHIRVRRSGKLAHRALLAQDESGNILLIVSKGRHTLWELAAYLERFPELLEVMCLDGGGEAQLALKVGDYAFNQYGVPMALPDLPWPSVKLPMALAVYPR